MMNTTKDHLNTKSKKRPDWLTETIKFSSRVWGSIRRRGAATSDRGRSEAVFQNFFLHIHSTRTHLNSLRLSYTMGFGVILASLFFILIGSGVLLGFYYKPHISAAYDSVRDISYVVPGGNFVRNIHRWAGELMVIFLFLHMARVFYTNSYQKPREFNWVIGIILFVITVMLNLTGYFLIWDQVGYWATRIVTNIAKSFKDLTDGLGVTEIFDIGGLMSYLMIGGNEVGSETIVRIYVTHVIFLPLALIMVLSLHIWRVRKDGGLSKPEQSEKTERHFFPTLKNKTYAIMAFVKGEKPATGSDMEDTVSSWPNLMIAELAIFLITFAGIMIMATFVNAPIGLPASEIPENPAKAPWYFLGLQELLSYNAFMGGVVIPVIVLVALAAIPYIDREPLKAGIWFSGNRGLKLTLVSASVGALISLSVLIFVVNFGWLQQWFPGAEINQLIPILFNPGNLLVLLHMLYSIIIIKRFKSTRMGAIALFSSFLMSYIILTYFATYMRGPNWEFFWSVNDWPRH